MKTKILLSALLMLFCLNAAKAQSHKVGQANYNCKLNKKGFFFNSEKLSCPACEVTEKKEKTARAAEDKRRNIAAVEKANAEKSAQEAAFKKKQTERDEKSKVTEVAVIAPKSGSSSNNNLTKNKTQVITQKGVKKQLNEVFMRAMSYGQGFVNAKTDENIILKDNDSRYKKVEGTFFNDGCGIQFGFPPNTGIVTFNSEIRVAEPLSTDLSSVSYYVQDLIDVNEKRTFNSDQVSSINHFYGNWFLIGYNVNKYGYVIVSFASAKLYNVKTKEYVNISEKTYFNTTQLDIIKFHGIEGVVAKNYRYIYNIYQSEKNSCYTSIDLSEPEIFMQKKLGGEEKWKALIIVNPISSKSDINFDRYVYYCDQNDNIVKMKITAEEARQM